MTTGSARSESTRKRKTRRIMKSSDHELPSGRRLVPLASLITIAIFAAQPAARAQIRELPPDIFRKPLPGVVIPQPMPIRPFPMVPVLPGQAVGQAKINADIDHRDDISRADRYAQNGRYDLAAIVWQKILDKSQDALATRDEWKYETVSGASFRRYSSLVAEIERTIATLPAAGLRAYRAQVDPAARAILDSAPDQDRETALGDIVRRFFLSSYGDEAALELASRALDRYDFVSAYQLLSRLRQHYPDSNIPAHLIDIRLAAAAAHVGDYQVGREIVDSLQSDRGDLSERVITLVDAEVQRLATGDVSSPNMVAQRNALLGTEARSGHMPELAMATLPAELETLWFDDFYRDPPKSTKPNGKVNRQPVPRPGPFDPPVRFQRRAPVVLQAYPRRPTTNVPTIESMESHWRQSQWRPSAQMLVHDGLAFFRSHDRVMCRNIATGKLQWMSREAEYLPVYVNPYLYHPRFAAAWPGRPLSRVPLEMLFFMDRAARSMSLCGDVLVAIEPMHPTRSTTVNRITSNPYVRRQQANQLAAYSQKNGKLIWSCEWKNKNETSAHSDFLAAPTPAGRWLVAPALRDDAIWLVAIDPTTGELGWQTQLCSQPDGNRSAYSSVGVAIEGATAYVATGAGVVAAVDTRWGNMQWVATYPRGRKQQAQTVLDGNEEDIVISHGPRVIVMASDSTEIFSVDRRSGALVWTTQRTLTRDARAVEYCLGTIGDYLYLAGSRVIRCYHMSGGRAVWEYPLSENFGRAALTERSIFVPVNNKILCLDPNPEPIPDDERLVRTLRVNDELGQPLGNLVSDGKNLLGLGLSRVYMLGAPEATAMLDGGGN